VSDGEPIATVTVKLFRSSDGDRVVSCIDAVGECVDVGVIAEAAASLMSYAATRSEDGYELCLDILRVMAMSNRSVR